jgi:hypothetical protein
MQNYSLTSGQKIDKIHTCEKFYPGLPNDYIVIQPWSKPSKNYSYWEEVLDLIYPYLQKNNIEILQLGAKDERPLKYCRHLQGSTNWGQFQYIISKSKLVLCTDSVGAHLAGHYNIPLVDLISNNFSNCVRPYFGDKSKQIILEPDRKSKNPMFSLDEGPNKQINEIKPEQIAKSVIKLLNDNFNYPYNTLYIGDLFNNKFLESAVTDVIDVKKLNAQNLVMRIDWNFNLAILQNQLALNPCQIITTKEIPLNILQKYKKNISGIVYCIAENNNPDFIKQLISLKIPYQLISELNQEKLNNIKLDYLDYSPIVVISKEMPDKLKNINIDNLYYKSSKLILGGGKFFASYQDYIIGRNINPTINEPIKIINEKLELLWEESEFMYFLEKLDTDKV